MKKTTRSPIVTPLLWGLGAILSIASVLVYKDLKPLNAMTLLKELREDFKLRGIVKDAWISSQLIPFDSETTVYEGGLYCQEGDELYYYEFLLDAYTGELIDAKGKPSPL